MEEADGARQRHLRRFEVEHFAANAPQLGQRRRGGHASAVDCRIEGSAIRRCRAVEAEADTHVGQLFLQPHEELARIEMGFLGEIKAVVEASGQVRFEHGDLLAIDMAVATRTRCEAPDLGGVATRRNQQCPVKPNGAGHRFLPPTGRLSAERHHGLFSALALAEGREHAAGEPGGASSERRPALDYNHAGAANCQCISGRETCNTGASDKNPQQSTLPIMQRTEVAATSFFPDG